MTGTGIKKLCKRKPKWGEGDIVGIPLGFACHCPPVGLPFLWPLRGTSCTKADLLKKELRILENLVLYYFGF